MPPLRFLDVPLLGDASLSHFAGADAAGAGWGPALWARRNVRLLTRQLDLEGLALRDTYLDTRDFCVALWDPGISHEAPTLDRRGLAQLSQGGSRTWTRNGPAWVESAAAARQGTVQLVELSAQQDKHTTLGTLIEASRTNGLIQSGFKNGTFTGWTLAGTGSNGSAITAETSDILFVAQAVGRVMKLLAGSPIHVADLQAQSTATASYAANAKVRVSIYRKDLTVGVGTWWALQRGVDSKWWRESDGTWQVAKTWNQAAYTADWLRDVSRQIDVGASGTTLTLFVGVPTAGGTAGEAHLVGHVQIEQGEYATSPILTEAAAVTRAADSLAFQNDHGKRVWPLAEWGGTARIAFRLLWSSSELAAGAVRTILEAYFDASNYDRVYYDQGTASLIFKRVRAGVATSATYATALTAGTLYRLAVRVASRFGEWGLAAYTQSIFLEGVKGTDAVAAGVHVLPSHHSFRVGTNDDGSGGSTNQVDGYYQDLDVTNLVLHDQEMLA